MSCASVVLLVVFESVGSTFMVGCDAVVCVYDVVGDFLGSSVLFVDCLIFMFCIFIMYWFSYCMC